MKKVISIFLIMGFLFVDFLFFHDAFKPGETISPAQYLTGILSFPVFALSIQQLFKRDAAAKKTH
jgi:hypothetical protein